MKIFNYEDAIKGEPICTSNGYSARIICTDAKSDYPIVFLYDNGECESICTSDRNGKCPPCYCGGIENAMKLMMVGVRKSINELIHIAADAFMCRDSDVFSKCRNVHMVEARTALCYYLNSESGLSAREISTITGADRTTIICMFKRFERFFKYDDVFRRKYECFIRAVNDEK